MKAGPNVQRLVCAKMARDAIPPEGGVQAGVNFLSDPKNIMEGFKSAAAYVASALLAIRQAAEPNPYKVMSDEEIAGALLKRIDEKRKARK